jgi:hypothetical protein
MTGTEIHRSLRTRSNRLAQLINGSRHFIAAAGVVAACITATGNQAAAQNTQPAPVNRFQGPSPKAGPSAGPTAARGQSVVPATQVPHNEIAPKVLGNAPARPTLKPDPKQLQVMAVVNSEQITQTELGRECLWRFGRKCSKG